MNCLPHFHHLTIIVLVAGWGVLWMADSQTTPLFPVACDLNILIVLDRSDSVKGGFNKSRKFVTDVSEELQIGPYKHRPAMIVYSGLSYRREVFNWNFAKSNEEFIRVTNNLRPIGGTTNTAKALEIANELMKTRNQSIPTLVLVVTDGRSADNPNKAAAAIRENKNTWMFVAATGDPEKVDVTELNEIAGSPYHVVLHRGRELATDITRKLLRQAQEKCKTTTSTTTTTTTTTTTNPITGCEMDLVLVLDFSTTTSPIYQKYKEMAVKLVNGLKIGPHYTRVAAITFATVGKTRTVFNLKEYDSSDEVIHALERMESSGGTTAVGAGIMEGIRQTQEKEGARPDIATKVMVVFTDGWNNKGVDPAEASAKATAEGFELYSCAFTGKVENVVQTNNETLLIVAKDNEHAFNDKNFDKLIAQVKKRNEKCMGGGSGGSGGAPPPRPRPPTRKPPPRPRG